MRFGKQMPKGPAKGVLRAGHRRLVVAFDDEQFDRLRQRAQRENTSVAEQVRLLVEWGFEADE